jgi:hypothetical protein
MRATLGLALDFFVLLYQDKKKLIMHTLILLAQYPQKSPIINVPAPHPQQKMLFEPA